MEGSVTDRTWHTKVWTTVTVETRDITPVEQRTSTFARKEPAKSKLTPIRRNEGSDISQQTV
jgi:hypothetical protein